MLRIGMLTSGGDCQALNATMRAIYLSAMNNAKEPVEFYGFEDGYKGLMYNRYRMLTCRFQRHPDTRRNHSRYEPGAVQGSRQAG